MPDRASDQPTAQSPLPDDGYATLNRWVVIRVSGPSTDTFLNGQLSQSLDDVTATFSPRAAACTPKGRSYALTRLVRDGDDVLLTLPESLADSVMAHLNKFLMLFRGTTMTVDSSARILGLFGTALAERWLAGAAANLAAPGMTAAVGPHRLIRTEDTAAGTTRFELWLNGPLSSADTDRLSGATEHREADWEASEIAAGIAALSPATREQYVPQMLNWQHVTGVHFKKGCYTGQEVIARMHFLGQLKKSLFRLSSDGQVGVGDAILSGDRELGNVVNAVRYDDGHSEMLAVLRHDGVGGSLALADGSVATLSPLPYAVPERDAAQGTG